MHFPAFFLLTRNEYRLTRKDLPSGNEQNTENTRIGLNCPIVSSKEFDAVDDDNVFTATIMAYEHILKLVQSSKTIIDTDFHDGNEMNITAPVPTSYEMRNIMKTVKITPSCCLSEKWRIINLLERQLDAFTRGRIIGKLEEGRSVTSVAAEFGIAHSIVSRLWRQFQTTGTAIRGFSSGRPRGTTPADDRYIVLQARRNRRQTAGEIARHTTQATGRPISRFTVARRLHGGGLFARRPVRCVPLTPAHRRRRSLWCREHRNGRDNEWGRVLFTDESRFSLSSDSHRILIWRERGSRNLPSNIIERDRYEGRGVLVW
ncbi:HTH_Tnp_Tc3_2 domain-containing protein [Trichonephila clavipes]|nr:HTH_Tnp_Tc3_2 domain-containing protein [Trichonephila clavipes]